MESPTLHIYARPTEREQLSWKGRAVALLVAMSCLGVLIVAAKLNPSGSGVGSHRQLGLADCQFESRTGLPCPTCGMTTSFAHFVRGQVVGSFWVQPMGMVLALITTMVFWVGLYVALSGRPAYRLLNLVPAKYYLWPMLIFGVAAWGWKIWIHVTGRDGWG
jgi:hypothetical protein